MSRAKIKGQSTLEYVILLGFVVAALIAMGVYMKRGSEGQLRRAADQVGEQYEAGETTGKFYVDSDIHQSEVNTAGHIQTEIINDTRKKSGWEEITALPAISNGTTTP